jgi:flagellar hook-associated protein 2
MAGSSFDSSVIDSTGKTSTAAQVTLDDNAQEGVYPVTINSIGSYASGVATSNWAPANRSSTFELVVGGQPHTITTTDNTATGIASAINRQYGNLVQASVLNFSSTDTRIALQSASLGQQTIDLQTSSGTSLFQQNVSGSQAEYTVMNGQPVFTNSRSAEISPGVTINMVAATTNPINISVSRSDSALSSALSSFATAYNAVEDAVTAQHGQNAGPLQGNTILSTVSHVLSQISLFSAGNGPVNSIYNLGLELNANGNMNGHLTFNPFKLAAADIGGSSDVDAFLGNSGSTGFLQNAINLLNNLEAPTTGLVKSMESNLQTQLTNIGTSISTKQDAVTRMQTSLTAQMAKADALIAATEQQFNYLNSVYQAQQMETLQYTQL